MTRVASALGTEIRILGPVELWRDGEPVHIGGPRQRALLVLLALRANEVVSSDRLVAELFGADAPETSPNAVQAAVSRLRRLLEPGALETRGGGYVLHAGADELDVVSFERLLAEGRAQLAGGDPAAAASTLRDALSLWRGEALGDVASLECAQSDARRLDELHVVGLMDRIEAELELGAAQQLVPELEGLVAEHPLQERLRGQLMLALYRSGRQAEALAAYRETRLLLREELGLEPSRALQELEQAILRQDSDLEASAASAEPVVQCPFKGLASFGTADAAYFFGRERLVDEVIARLVDHPFVGLVGSSGSGKSSLLQAGVVASLAAGALPGSTAWRRTLVRPGAHPLAVLPEEAEVLAVDQLEEAFTSCRDEGERAAFFAELARRAGAGTIVLVALRGDFYGRCGAYPEFAALLSSNHVLLGAMRRDELAHAIEGPAERAGLQVERELVELLVGDVAGEPGALPLLSTTLVELWRRRTGRLLTAASYRDSGGVRGAVARLAEHAFGQLNEGEQRAARVVMLRLADEEDGAIVRRRIPVDELDIATDDDVARAVGVLVESRLLTVADGTLEVSHESLLAEWPRLRVWLDEDRAGRRLRAHLATSAREWDQRGREPADLYRGPRLAAALDWSADHPDEPNALEREFLEASRTEHERALARQRKRNRRLRSALVGVVVLLGLAVVAGVVALVQRRTARREATMALARELGARAVVEPRLDRAMLLAAEAVRLQNAPDTRGTLLSTLLRSPAAISTFSSPITDRPQAVSVSPDGRTLAVAENTNFMRFYDTQTRQERRSALPNADHRAPTFSRDGKLVLFFRAKKPGGDMKLEVLDGRTLRHLRFLPTDKQWQQKPTSFQEPLLVSGDDRYAYLAWSLIDASQTHDLQTYVSEWDLRTGALRTVKVPGARGMFAARLAGTQLEIVTDNAVVRLDMSSLREVGSRAVHLPQTSAIAVGALSPDGRTLIMGGVPSGAVWFVDLERDHTTQGTGSTGVGGQAVAYSPAGPVAVSTYEDGQVTVWNTRTAQVTDTFKGHEDRVLGVTFSADGRTLYTCSLDGAIFAWDISGTRRFGHPFALPATNTLNLPAPSTPPLTVSADSRFFATRLQPLRVGIFSTSSLRRKATIRVTSKPGNVVDFVAWSPREPLLAVASSDGTIGFWNVAGSPRLVRTLRPWPSDPKDPAYPTALAFTPDGSRIVEAAYRQVSNGYIALLGVWRDSDGRVVWNKTYKASGGDQVAVSDNGREIAFGRYLPNQGYVVDVVSARNGTAERALHPLGSGVELAFAPDGRLETGIASGIVQSWDMQTGKEIGRPLLAMPAPVSSLAFEPRSYVFATGGGSGGFVKLWDARTLEQIGSALPGSLGRWANAVFTPDGTRLVTIYDDGHGAVWPVTLAAWKAQVCRVAGRNLTRGEWSRFVPGRPYAKICG
jgi:DNA-binding SARP family transcriptional activator/WD40 repeat protein